MLLTSQFLRKFQTQTEEIQEENAELKRALQKFSKRLSQLERDTGKDSDELRTIIASQQKVLQTNIQKV